MQQLIDMCIETRDSALYNTLCNKLKHEQNYSIESLQILNDLIIEDSIFINHLIIFLQYDKLKLNKNIDPLLIEKWCDNSKNWKLYLLIFKICQIYNQLTPKSFLPPLPNHLPSFIILQYLQKREVNINIDNFTNVYHVKEIKINGNTIHTGDIYIQSLTSSLYIFISNESILIELTNIKYNKDSSGNITLFTSQNNIWCLIGNLKINNIKSITFNPQPNNNNNNPRSRISTSENILRLNGGDLTPTQESVVITKCNLKPHLNIAKVKKPVVINKKNKKKSSAVNKILKQKQLNNVKQIVNIESSQVEELDEPIIKIEPTMTKIDEDSTTILPGENSKEENSEEPINIHNPAISPSINNTLTIPTHDFTNLLQNQIQNSIDQFTQDLIKKINLLNLEVNEQLLQPLLSKYQSRLSHLQQDFQHDIQDLTTNINDLFTKLHWNQTDLNQFLISKPRRAT